MGHPDDGGEISAIPFPGSSVPIQVHYPELALGLFSSSRSPHLGNKRLNQARGPLPALLCYECWVLGGMYLQSDCGYVSLTWPVSHSVWPSG